jgi:hypothetical protein
MAQQMAATGKRPIRLQAAMMPMIRAMVPHRGDIVVWIILGKVITASVT